MFFTINFTIPVANFSDNIFVIKIGGWNRSSRQLETPRSLKNGGKMKVDRILVVIEEDIKKADQVIGRSIMCNTDGKICFLNGGNMPTMKNVGQIWIVKVLPKKGMFMIVQPEKKLDNTQLLQEFVAHATNALDESTITTATHEKASIVITTEYFYSTVVVSATMHADGSKKAFFKVKNHGWRTRMGTNEFESPQPLEISSSVEKKLAKVLQKTKQAADVKSGEIKAKIDAFFASEPVFSITGEHGEKVCLNFLPENIAIEITCEIKPSDPAKRVMWISKYRLPDEDWWLLKKALKAPSNDGCYFKIRPSLVPDAFWKKLESQGIVASVDWYDQKEFSLAIMRKKVQTHLEQELLGKSAMFVSKLNPTEVLRAFAQFQEVEAMTGKLLPRQLGMKISTRAKKGGFPTWLDQLQRTWTMLVKTVCEGESYYLVPVDNSRELPRKGYKPLFKRGQHLEKGILQERIIALIRHHAPHLLERRRLWDSEQKLIPKTTGNYLTKVSREGYSDEPGPHKDCTTTRPRGHLVSSTYKIVTVTDNDKESAWLKAKDNGVGAAVSASVRDQELVDLGVLRKDHKEIYFAISLVARRAAVTALGDRTSPDDYKSMEAYQEEVKEVGKLALPPLLDYLFSDGKMPEWSFRVFPTSMK